MNKQIWEVYKDGSYLTQFNTEAEAKAYCEERNWAVEDEEYGFEEELSYHKVEKIEWARHKSDVKACLIVGDKCYKPTGYNVVFGGKWYVELTADGKTEYVSASLYSNLWHL